jgi:hypothetical protein
MSTGTLITSEDTIKWVLEERARALRPLLSAGAEASAARRGDMSHRERINLVLVILAVIGAIAVVAVLGMWLMHATMMGGIMGCGGLFVGFLTIAALVTAGLVLVRRQERPSARLRSRDGGSGLEGTCSTPSGRS